ncbi:transglutaminase TgpA family protein [Thalassotalea ganghwensis]
MVNNVVKDQLDYSSATQYLLIISMAFNGLTLVANISIWLIAFYAISLIWQVCLVTKLCSTPTRALKLIVSISGLILLAISAKQLGALNAMVHLLFFAYLLKPLEVNSNKDFYLLVLLGFFVIVTSLIFNQSLYFMLVVLLVILINFAVLLSFHFNSNSTIQYGKTSLGLLLKSAPLAALLFVIFPKIPPFWQMPTAKNANTGISDTVKIGDIANLALSNDLAFRVEFDDFTPSNQQLYWRGIVLDRFDGVEWSTSSLSRATKLALAKQNERMQTTRQSTKALSYRILIEPTYQPWLFALNQISSVDSSLIGIDKTYQYTLEATKEIVAPINYSVTSNMSNTIDVDLSKQQKQYFTVIPESNPRLIEKGQQLRNRHAKNIDIVNAVLTTFNQNNYRYTLKPPLLNNNSLDQFFFDTKSGFCEHYASSFTYLMRAAGIPARIVVGYLGGEYNQQANYYGVYQRDAHAWSEVWIEGIGWLRIDPTAAVNPDRVERGFNQSLGQEQAGINNEFLSFISASYLLTNIKNYLEALDYEWTKWVVNYSSQDQTDILQGIKSFLFWSLNYQTLIIVAITLVIAFYFSYRFYKHKVNQDDTLVAYHKLVALIEKIGFVHHRKTTATDVRAFLLTKQPQLKEAIEGFYLTFNDLRYGDAKMSNSKRRQLVVKLSGYLNKIKAGLVKSEKNQIVADFKVKDEQTVDK